MARRPLMQREVTDVAMPQDQTAEAYQGVQDTINDFQTLQRKKELANIKTYMSQANADMLQMTNQWRVDNQSDPSNQESLGKLQSGYDKILTQYGQKVGMFGKGDWMQVGERLKAQYRADNINWADRQTTVNAENGINNGISADMQIYRKLGNSFDFNKFRGSYMTSREVLMKFGGQVLGKDKTDNLMKDYLSDSWAMFLYGTAENHPEKAEILLNSQRTRDEIGNPDKIETLRRFISRQKELKKQGVELAQNEAEDQMTDKFLQDKLTIMDLDSAMKKNQVRPEFAQQMKDALLSDKAVGAVTNGADFTKAVDMIFNSKKDLKDINNYLLAKTAEGKLSQDDSLVIKTFANNIIRRGYKWDDIKKKLMPAKQHKDAWDRITWWHREYEGEGDGSEQLAVVTMWKQYVGLVGQGKSPQDALNEVISHRKTISGYKVGEFKTFLGRTWKLVGFYDDGEPNFEPVR